MNTSNAVSRLAPLRVRLAGKAVSLLLPNTFRIDDAIAGGAVLEQLSQSHADVST